MTEMTSTALQPNLTQVHTTQGHAMAQPGRTFVVINDSDVPTTWRDQALCAQTDPEAFFPEKGGSTREAKRVCQTCDVRRECLEFALQNDERFGIWGGMSERERRRLRREAV